MMPPAILDHVEEHGRSEHDEQRPIRQGSHCAISAWPGAVRVATLQDVYELVLPRLQLPHKPEARIKKHRAQLAFEEGVGG